jgi:glycosyltransferase involved in cell wall biosynthesis
MPATAPHHDAQWRRRFADALDAAAAIIVPSNSTRDDLLGGHPIDPSKVRVVHHGASSWDVRPSARDIADARARFGVPERYVVFIGGIEPRKNLERLARSFTRVGTDAALVIAGGPVRWIPKAAARLDRVVDDLGEGHRIIRTGYVSGREKAALLAGATVLAYPSLYEGFGFPVLEGFTAGVPVLTSNTSSLPEVVGDAAVMVDPTSEEEIAAGLARLLGDEELRARLREAGRERVGSFTWEACARATADALKDALVFAHG